MMKLFRNISKYLILVLSIVSLVGCGKKSVDESKIKQDILEQGVNINNTTDTLLFGNRQAKVDEIIDLSIEKRQTDEKNKVDKIYINLKFKNGDFTASGTYEMTYGLYEEGWILDSTYVNSDLTSTYDKEVTEEDFKEMLGIEANQTLEIESSEVVDGNIEIIAIIGTINEGVTTKEKSRYVYYISKPNQDKDSFTLAFDSRKTIEVLDKEFETEFSKDMVDFDKITNELVGCDVIVSGGFFNDANFKIDSKEDISQIRWNGDFSRDKDKSVTLNDLIVTLNKKFKYYDEEEADTFVINYYSYVINGEDKKTEIKGNKYQQ